MKPVIDKLWLNKLKADHILRIEKLGYFTEDLKIVLSLFSIYSFFHAL